MVNSVVLVGKVHGDPSYTYAESAAKWMTALANFDLPAEIVTFTLDVARPKAKGDETDQPAPADTFRVHLDGAAALAFQQSRVGHGQLLGIQGRIEGVTGGSMVLIRASNIRLLTSKAV